MSSRPIPSLPTGVVTFLLTDVEGSTRLWRQAPGAAALLARQAELIAVAVARHGGVRPLEQGEGDSTVAVFARPSDALAAALDAQRALGVEAWPADGVVRVRMALHSGEAELRDDATYGGESIIRCARLRGLARGGHVLVSNATAALTAHQLPDGAALSELPRVTLDGFAGSEPVHQLLHAELDASPALRATTVRALPQWPTPLVGRQRERAEVAALLDGARLLTLTGAGGSGKTRLAHALAGELAERWSDGVAWVELARLSNGAQVAGAIAAACGAQEIAGASAIEALVAHLARRSMLIVLDNCEHVLDDSARLAEAIVRGAERVTVVATSREPLGSSGEVTWRIPSLALPDETERDAARLAEFDAVRLFSARARAARPDFALDADSAPVVARICRRLDGIPLALELAAARLRALSLRQLAEGLDDRFRLLTGGARTAMARQRTLLASVEWSHELLDEDEQLVFRRLGVFAAPFTLTAAEAVASDDALDRLAVFDLLARLIDKSLLQHVGERYVMLETLRQYALERARDAGELSDLRDRQLAWCLRRAGDWRLDREIATDPLVDQIAAEAPDLIAAVEWSLTPGRQVAIAGLRPLGEFWLARQAHGAVRSVGGAVLGALDEGSPDWLAAVAALAQSLFLAGELGWIAGAREGLRAGGDRLDPWLRGRLEMALAFGPMLSGEAEGPEGLRRAIECGAASGDRGLELYATLNLGLHTLAQGDPAGARPWIDWLDRHTPPDAAQRFLLQGTHALLATYDGDFARAVAPLAEPIKRLDDVRQAGPVAGVAFWTCDSALLRQLDAALSGFADLGAFAVFAKWVSAMAALVDGRLEVARSEFEATACLWGPGHLMLSISSMLADTLLSLGDAPAAERALDDALALDRAGVHLHYSRLQTQLSRAAIELSRGGLPTAENLAQTALASGVARGLILGQTDALETLALILATKGDAVQAARLLGAAEAFRARTNYRWRFPHRRRDLDALRPQLDATHLAEGAALSLAEAAEYARRGWGERGRPNHGWESLTPSELRVVELVAAGLPNRDIAAKLFVSLATVKTHLVHVYTKLDVGSRTELAAAATRRGLAASSSGEREE